MSIEIKCPECGSEYHVAAHADGKQVRCKHCENVFVAVGQAPSFRTVPEQEILVEPEFDEPTSAGVRTVDVAGWRQESEEQLRGQESNQLLRQHRVPTWVWALFGMTLIVPCLCSGFVVLIVNSAGDEIAGEPGVTVSQANDLVEARSEHKTKLITQGPSWQDFDNAVPNKAEVVEFPSGKLKLFGWFAKPEGDGPFPAVLHAHGGFALGAQDFDDVRPYLDAGFAVFVPAWRGENGNPGDFEMYYGEVDDALAALEYLETRDDIDANRLYASGHSAGGTIVMLLAELAPQLKAVLACGACPDTQAITDWLDGPTDEFVPYDWENDHEGDLRSPARHIKDLKCPMLLTFGLPDDEVYMKQAIALKPVATKLGKTVEVFGFAGMDHYKALAPAIEQSIGFFRTHK